MGATELQKNWQEMRKTLGKPGFCSGEDRNRTFGCFPNVSGMFEGYLLTLAYADNKPVALARLGEYLDFQGLERDYESIRSAEIA